MEHAKSTVLTTSGHSQPAFNLEYLKKNLSHIDISVPSYENDFMDHTNYKVVFTQDPHQVVFVASKRFNDFVALHEVIKMKLENIEIKSFPSKFQIFNKTETRRAYFDEMLKRLLYAAKQHEEIRHKVLGMLISFVNLKNKAGKEEVVKGGKPTKSEIFGNEDEAHSSRAIGTEKATASQKSMDVPVEVVQQKLERVVEQAEEEQRLIDEGRADPILVDKMDDRTNVILMKFEKDDEWKKKYLKIRGNFLEIYKDISHNMFETQVELFGITVEYLTQSPTLVDELCLKMEFRDDQPVYPPDYQYLSIFHEYDHQKILFSTPESVSDKPCEALEDLRVRFTKASHQAQFSTEYKGFFSQIGKVYIALYGFKLLKTQNTTSPEKLMDKEENNWLKVRIRTQAFNYETKKVELKDENVIKQGFIIPITNVFEEIHIELVHVVMKGWLIEAEKEAVIGRYILRVSDILSYNRGYNFQKVIFRMEEAETGNSVANLTATIRNLSQFSSMYAESFASENDGEYINYEEMSIKESLNSVEMTLDRLLYIFGKIGIFLQTLWRNVYCFKYPRLAIMVLTLVALAFVFLDMSNIVLVMTIGLCSVIIYHHRSVYPIVEQLMDRFLVGKNHIHKNYINPKILSKAEFKYMKWAHNHILLKQKILERSGEAPARDSHDKKKEEITFEKTKKFFFLKKGGNMFKIQDEEQGIFEKISEIKLSVQEIHNTINSIVNFIEKIGSLFTWVDFRRTLCFLIIFLGMVLISNAMAFRFLGVALCFHRFIKGNRYYKKHYGINRKLAEECLKYIITKSFKDIKKELDTKSIDKVTFPISEEEFKKLKQELESLIPVCINASEMTDIQDFISKYHSNQAKVSDKKALKQRYLPYIEGDKIRLAFFIDMIESCESRLRLEKVITNEGRTQEYQDLRNVTKESPVIDIWLEELVGNFILNTPSLFYDYLHRSSDSIIHRDDEEEVKKVEQVATKEEDLKDLQEPISV